MRIICVIPARYGSIRFPGKPLAELYGKPLIQWVYEQAQRTQLIQDVYVATDDDRIFRAVKGFGGSVCMTSPDCASGTDRIAAAVKNIEADIIVNIQGDEPQIDPNTVDETIRGLIRAPECVVSTPAVAIRRIEDFTSPHVVKVVFDIHRIACYFSRSPIPSRSRCDEAQGTDDILGYKHLGLYVYRREALEKFCSMKPTRLEQIEKLEQLRFLEHGYRIKVVLTEKDSIGIDTLEDLEAIKKKMERQ